MGMNTPLHEPVPRKASRSASTRWTIMAVAALVLQSTSVLSSAAAATASTGRPSVSIVLTDTKVAAPKTLPGGIVDVTMDARQSKTRAHHLAFFRRNDGVTMKQVLAAPDADFDKYVTYQGGNSSVDAGKSSRVTLDLQPGNYMIADFADGPPLITETVVTAPATPAKAPATKGTVTMGPGMAFSIPKGFDAAGTWRSPPPTPCPTKHYSLERTKAQPSSTLSTGPKHPTNQCRLTSSAASEPSAGASKAGLTSAHSRKPARTTSCA